MVTWKVDLLGNFHATIITPSDFTPDRSPEDPGWKTPDSDIQLLQPCRYE
jgi:hypothetical protein